MIVWHTAQCYCRRLLKDMHSTAHLASHDSCLNFAVCFLSFDWWNIGLVSRADSINLAVLTELYNLNWDLSGHSSCLWSVSCYQESFSHVSFCISVNLGAFGAWWPCMTGVENTWLCCCIADSLQPPWQRQLPLLAEGFCYYLCSSSVEQWRVTSSRLSS